MDLNQDQKKSRIQIKGNSPEWKFGTEEKGQKKIKVSPGPAEYNPRELSPASRAAFFGSSSRLPLSQDLETPGAGTYDVLTHPDSPKYTMQGRPIQKIEEVTPGPASYNQETNDFINKTKSPSYKFGTDSKSKSNENLNPAGADYNVEPRKSGPEWKFGTETREKIEIKDQPGPADYNPRDASPSSRANVFGTGQRSELSKVKDTPGPGHYELDLKEKGVEWKFSTEKREKPQNETKPGPADYNPREVSPSRIAPVFGTSERTPLYKSEETPAPGTYDLKGMPEGLKYTIQARPREIQTDPTPAPNTYNQEKNDFTRKDHSPSYRFGNEPREKVLKNNNPSPGDYDVELKGSDPEWKFSQEPKLKTTFKDGPSPADYTPREISPSSRAAFFGSSERPTLNAHIKYSIETPGVGSYELRGKPEGPKYSMQSRPQENIIDSNPAPNSYNQEINEFTTKEKSPAYRFGTESREKVNKNENPSPVGRGVGGGTPSRCQMQAQTVEWSSAGHGHSDRLDPPDFCPHAFASRHRGGESPPDVCPAMSALVTGVAGVVSPPFGTRILVFKSWFRLPFRAHLRADIGTGHPLQDTDSRFQI